MKYIYLYGAGGHAKVIVDILQSQGMTVIEIFDDDKNLTDLFEIPITQREVQSPLIISIGDNKIRKIIAETLNEIQYASAISPRAIVSSRAIIGHGTVIMSGAAIQTSANIGSHVIINTCSVIEHDCRVHDFAHISPNTTLCGNVTIGEGAQVGAGTVIIPGIEIGKWAVIGAGSVVTTNIPDYAVAVGVPCKIIKYTDINEYQ